MVTIIKEVKNMGVKFGPGGNPLDFSQKGYKSSVDMPLYLKDIGLNAYEYQCNKGVKISEKTAGILAENAKKNDIFLSVHSHLLKFSYDISHRKSLYSLQIYHLLLPK